METKFKSGDAVVLIVPPYQQMRVESINEDGSYKCIWAHGRKNKITHNDYSESLLAPFVSISQRRVMAVFRSGL